MATKVETMAPGQTPTVAPHPEGVRRAKGPRSLFTPELMGPALRDSVKKLDPRTLVLNPVMFVVEIGSVLTTIMLVKLIADGGADIKRIVVSALIVCPRFSCIRTIEPG